MADPDALSVQVVYALPDVQAVVNLRLPPGATAADAVRLSGLCERFASIDPAGNRLGIFGQLCAPETRLREGDRVEIYRPLQADPKEARRRRARDKR